MTNKAGHSRSIHSGNVLRQAATVISLPSLLFVVLASLRVSDSRAHLAMGLDRGVVSDRSISVLEELKSPLSESQVSHGDHRKARPRIAQVTVRPGDAKRVFEEEENKPWTLLVGKAMLSATAALGAFVVIWYVMKVTRARYKRSP